MLFRQLFDRESYTYSYLLADKKSKEAIIIDPVYEKVSQYIQLLSELGLTLRYAVDTHVHADHITALASLRQHYQCETVHGEQSVANGITHPIRNNQYLTVGALKLRALYTPGHTDDSYCYLLEQPVENMLFTGDTLLIKGTGRTDFQNGCSLKQYDSLFNKLLCLDGETMIYPGHDYDGLTVSTIAEEKKFNPRLQVGSAIEYSQMMDNLKLAMPKKIDIAVPANLAGGR